MAKNPVAYAENDLGVHELWKEFGEHSEAFRLAQEVHLAQVVVLRSLRDQIAAREHQIATEKRGEYHELSETAFTRELRSWVMGDEELKGMRAQVRVAESANDIAEADMKRHQLHMTGLAARMQELGGLLVFYAAAKGNTTSQ